MKLTYWGGKVAVVAETPSEIATLVHLTDGKTERKTAETNAITKRSYTRHCPVTGCSGTGVGKKGMASHMAWHHGSRMAERRATELA